VQTRLDAAAKATGRARYVDDLSLPGCLHVAYVRSTMPHARIRRVDASEALALAGVLGVLCHDDLGLELYGRSVRDVPMLAKDKVRFLGERVCAVVAETRLVAKAAADCVVVEYEPLPAVLDPEEALSEGAPAVHEAPWSYEGSVVRPGDPVNLQSEISLGDRDGVEEVLRASAFVHEATYTTRALHQGYLEPHACLAEASAEGTVRLWITNKAPYRLRDELALCCRMEKEAIDIQPITLGGDFGGKGSAGDAPIAIALARRFGRPVKIVASSSEDLSATELRHPVRVRVKIGCDRDGRFSGLLLDALANGGAYGGYKPLANVSLHGLLEPPCYRLSAFASRVRIASTNTVPKGHMRAPGAPQAVFAIESAVDELASACGLSPVELRRRNLLANGEAAPFGRPWREQRGAPTLEAAVAATSDPAPAAPEGWATGTGVALYARSVGLGSTTSLRISARPGGGVHLDIPLVETGAGAQSALWRLAAQAFGLDVGLVEITQVPTSELPGDPGVFGSRTTTALAVALEQAARHWRASGGEGELTVVVDEPPGEPLGSYCVQVARVAVDPETGCVRVLELVSALDVGSIVNERAHQMQVDGGAVMGYGFACLEDAEEADGMVFAANLGEARLPSVRDVPRLRTVLVKGGRGIGAAGVKAVGELTNVPTAAAIANAVADALGCRVRDLPLRAAAVHGALRDDNSLRREQASP
jgi:CO/xanthine dehydrogenase Mo-binding subunit